LLTVATPLGDVAAAVSVPVIAATAGGMVATYRPPGPKVRSGVQHFAAGLVFAAAATELVPDLSHEHHRIAIAVGFTVGLALMLAVEFLPAGLLGPAGADSPASALTAIAIDVFIDGLLIGIGFSRGGHTGILLTGALTVELAFLGLATAVALQTVGSSHTKVIATTFGISLLVAAGAILGATALAHLSGAALTGTLAFGTVALLFLVTEELLAEAHERPDTPLLTTMFFVGFLAMLLASTFA
jgi:ZIP family zinc transporter